MLITRKRKTKARVPFFNVLRSERRRTEMEIGIPFSNVVRKRKKEMEVLSHGSRLSTRNDHV